MSTATPTDRAVETNGESDRLTAVLEDRLGHPATSPDFDLKQGSFVNAGDPIAKIGRLDRVRVTVYVDEPDLGRERVGIVQCFDRAHAEAFVGPQHVADA